MSVVHTLRRLTKEVAESLVQDYIVRLCLRKQEEWRKWRETAGESREQGREGKKEERLSSHQMDPTSVQVVEPEGYATRCSPRAQALSVI